MQSIFEITLGAYDLSQITEIIKVEANAITEADKNTIKSQMDGESRGCNWFQHT